MARKTAQLLKSHHFQDLLSESNAPLVRYEACKNMARGYASSTSRDSQRLAIARSYCAAVIKSYWAEVNIRHGSSLAICSTPGDTKLAKITIDAEETAKRTGAIIAMLPDIDAGYLIGSIYTVMLPTEYRSKLGAYYTPPPLVSRLLDLAEEAGIDFGKASVIDPACGGGAFLAPVAARMIARCKKASAEWQLAHISGRIKGIEIDPFAAWMTHVLLETTLIELCLKARKRLPESSIQVGDALLGKTGKANPAYDLVIGNPPYGKMSLSQDLRDKYARSLFGHANLYGLFTDLALRLTKPKGVIAYLTPTSFLGGQYFKSLRQLLLKESCPCAFDFISNREGVFDDVLQETLLTTFRKTAKPEEATVSLLVPQGLNQAKVETIGTASVASGDGPWLIPRTVSDAKLLKRIRKMKNRLPDLGYVVSTGKLVWNRHKAQLSENKSKKSLPVIWAESVTNSGFRFSSDKRNHAPYIEVTARQQHLISLDSCILVQRTTSKEQERRVVGAIVPQEFIDKSGGIVVENHLNMIFSDQLVCSVSADTINSILNSKIFDRLYRCISGSVAVSAYELMSVPLPDTKNLIKLQQIIEAGSDRPTIEKHITRLYGEHKVELATST